MPIISSAYNSRMAKEALVIQTKLNKQEKHGPHIIEQKDTNQCIAAYLKFQFLKNQSPKRLIGDYSTFRQSYEKITHNFSVGVSSFPCGSVLSLLIWLQRPHLSGDRQIHA